LCPCPTYTGNTMSRADKERYNAATAHIRTKKQPSIIRQDPQPTPARRPNARIRQKNNGLHPGTSGQTQRQLSLFFPAPKQDKAAAAKAGPKRPPDIHTPHKGWMVELFWTDQGWAVSVYDNEGVYKDAFQRCADHDHGIQCHNAAVAELKTKIAKDELPAYPGEAA